MKLISGKETAVQTCVNSCCRPTSRPRRYTSSLHEQYSPNTIARKCSSLRTLYKWLAGEKMVAANPTIHLYAPKCVRQAVKPITSEEMAKVLAIPDATTLSGARDLAIMHIMYTTGAKISELIEIPRSAINSEADGRTLRLMGINARPRIISLNDTAHAALLTYLKMRDAAFCESHTVELFVNKFGRSLSSRSVRRKIASYMHSSSALYSCCWKQWRHDRGFRSRITFSCGYFIFSRPGKIFPGFFYASFLAY